MRFSTKTIFFVLLFSMYNVTSAKEKIKEEEEDIAAIREGVSVILEKTGVFKDKEIARSLDDLPEGTIVALFSLLNKKFLKPTRTHQLGRFRLFGVWSCKADVVDCKEEETYLEVLRNKNESISFRSKYAEGKLLKAEPDQKAVVYEGRKVDSWDEWFPVWDKETVFLQNRFHFFRPGGGQAVYMSNQIGLSGSDDAVWVKKVHSDELVTGKGYREQFVIVIIKKVEEKEVSHEEVVKNIGEQIKKVDEAIEEKEAELVDLKGKLIKLKKEKEDLEKKTDEKTGG